MTTKADAVKRFETAALRAFPQLDRPRAMAAFMRTEQGNALYADYISADPGPVAAPVAKALRTDQVIAEEVKRRTEAFAKERKLDYGRAFKRLTKEDPTFRGFLRLHESARRNLVSEDRRQRSA